jgi:acyl-CoA thioester hydrolase
MRIFETNTRVRYAETDATAIVYYGTYFVYFELGRIEMFRELGLPYDRRLPIVETHCRYHASAAFDDRLRVETSLEEAGHRSFRLGSRVFRIAPEGDDAPATDELLVEGWTVMVTVDDDNHPIPLPVAFLEAFEKILQ